MLMSKKTRGLDINFDDFLIGGKIPLENSNWTFRSANHI
jgi:hypothetical protein